MPDFVADFRRLLDSKHHRMTKCRLRLAQSIANLPPGGIVDPEALSKQLHAEKIPGTSRAAVYRTIELMLDGDLLTHSNDGGLIAVRRF